MARLTTVVVDLELARRMCAAARREAAPLGALVSVAVVDAGGHLVAFERMDGAEIAGPVLARDKAYTAVAHRCPTADLADAERPRRRAGRSGAARTADATSASAAACRCGGRAAWSAASASAAVAQHRTSRARGPP